MIEAKCDHKWKLYTDVGRDASIPATYKCDKCSSVMTAPEVHQLESLKHLKGFQSYTAIIALVISFFALVISILK